MFPNDIWDRLPKQAKKSFDSAMCKCGIHHEGNRIPAGNIIHGVAMMGYMAMKIDYMTCDDDRGSVEHVIRAGLDAFSSPLSDSAKRKREALASDFADYVMSAGLAENVTDCQGLTQLMLEHSELQAPAGGMVN